MPNLDDYAGDYGKNYTLARASALGKLPPYREAFKDGFLTPETTIHFRFFAPIGHPDVWYVVAGSPDTKGISQYANDWLLYGLIVTGAGPLDWEWGSFSLRALEAIRLPCYLRIESTRGWTRRKVKDQFHDRTEEFFGGYDSDDDDDDQDEAAGDGPGA